MFTDENKKKGFNKKDMISSAVKKELSESAIDRKKDSYGLKAADGPGQHGEMMSYGNHIKDEIHGKKNIAFSGIFILFLIGLAAYFLFFNPFWVGKKTPILLSSNPITANDLDMLAQEEDLVFHINKPVYVYYNWEKNPANKEITIAIYEIMAKPKVGSNKLREMVAENTYELNNPKIDKIYTLFQSDFFVRSGEYEIQVKEGQTILEARKFRITDK